MNVRDEARTIALDEVRWRQANGFTPRDCLKAVGASHNEWSGWDDVMAALVDAWLKLDPVVAPARRAA